MVWVGDYQTEFPGCGMNGGGILDRFLRLWYGLGDVRFSCYHIGSGRGGSYQTDFPGCGMGSRAGVPDSF